jgi:hypothetical protein
LAGIARSLGHVLTCTAPFGRQSHGSQARISKNGSFTRYEI